MLSGYVGNFIGKNNHEWIKLFMASYLGRVYKNNDTYLLLTK